MGRSADLATITKDTAVDLTAPEDYLWKDNSILEVKPEKKYAATLSLDGNLAANFFIKGVRDGSVADTYEIECSSTDYNLEHAKAKPQKLSDGHYGLLIDDIYVYQMGETITVKIYEGGSETPTEIKLTVADTIKTLKELAPDDSELQALCNGR